MSTDCELLRRYVNDRHDDAFAELVRRHVDLVYASALRRANGNGALAEDATQQTFIRLAQSARKLTAHPTVGGWLYVTARHAAATLMRSEHTRKAREQEASMITSSADPEWHRLRPELEALIEGLEARERDAIVLRFFEARRFAEIGAALGISEDGARMRVERALGRLQRALSRRGVNSTAAVLGAALAGPPMIAAPAAVTSAAISAALGAGAGNAAMVAGISTSMSTTKVILGGVALVAAATAAFVFVQNRPAFALATPDRHIQANLGGHTPLAPSAAVAPESVPIANRVAAAGANAKTSRVQSAETTPDVAANVWFRGVVDVNDWKDRGTASPAAALETYLWAGDHIDLDARASTLGFGAMKPEVDDFFRRLSPDVRKQYGSPERLWAELMAGAPQAPRITGFNLLSETPNPPLDAAVVTLRLRTVDAQGVSQEGNMVFEHSPTGWRRTLPPSLITPVFALFPSAKPRPK